MMKPSRFDLCMETNIQTKLHTNKARGQVGAKIVKKESESFFAL